MKTGSQLTAAVVLSSFMELEQHEIGASAGTSALGPPDPAAQQLASERSSEGIGSGAAAGAAAQLAGVAGLAPLPRLAAELRNGVRAALGLRVGLDRLQASPARLALLALLDVVVNLVVSFLLVGRGGYFSYSAVPSFFFHLPLFLFFGLLAAKILSRRSLIPGIASLLVALSIPIEFCHALLEWLAQLRQFDWLEDYLSAPHYYRFFWWWAAAALLFLLRLEPAAGWRRLRLPLIFLLLVLPPLWFYSRGDLWVSAAENSESGELHLTEEVLSAQDRLLTGELAALLPGKPGTTDLYFLGFAGDATQDVFLKELTAARKLFSERFGSSGRSILLVNNPQTAATLPFATAGNLERALKGLGQVMNRAEDVLFLYISSHGSREHELEVNNRPLELKGLTPEQLQRMLRNSGITWKVVVVSACFSGGFIEPLQDDTSLIITAADATHESFGCGYGEEFTWFGHAFLGDALRHSFSFTDAFERARDTIRQWEEERGETPSNPQIWGGKSIWPKLKSLENELVQREAKVKSR